MDADDAATFGPPPVDADALERWESGVCEPCWDGDHDECIGLAECECDNLWHEDADE